MSYCAKCGAPLPRGAQFCPRCGTPLPIAPAPVAPPSTPPRFAWWIIPLVVVGLVVVVWLVLAGLPFGGRDREPETPRVETIAEGTVAPSSPRGTGTIIDIAGERAVPEPEPARQLDDEQASATLRAFVTSRDYYDAGDDCVRVESRGFRNRGFDYEVWHSCERDGGSRLLGRWRVDALTREVFRQYDDGRYLRP